MAQLDESATESLNGLIAVLHDGLEIHRAAMGEIKDDAVKKISKDMISLREETIKELQPLVRSGGKEPTSRGTFIGDARKMMAKAKSLVGDKKTAYASELARVESMTVSSIDTCLEDATQEQIKNALSPKQEKFRKAADKLKSLADKA